MRCRDNSPLLFPPPFFKPVQYLLPDSNEFHYVDSRNFFIWISVAVSQSILTLLCPLFVHGIFYLPVTRNVRAAWSGRRAGSGLGWRLG